MNIYKRFSYRSRTGGFTLTEVVVSVALLGLIFGIFQMSQTFLSRSNYAKKPEIILNVNSAMHKLRSGAMDPDKTSWRIRSIRYSAYPDISQQDSIVYIVQAIDPESKERLFTLRQVEMKD